MIVGGMKGDLHYRAATRSRRQLECSLVRVRRARHNSEAEAEAEAEAETTD